MRVPHILSSTPVSAGRESSRRNKTHSSRPASASGVPDRRDTPRTVHTRLSACSPASPRRSAGSGWWLPSRALPWPEFTAASVIVAAAMEECSAHERRLEHGRLTDNEHLGFWLRGLRGLTTCLHTPLPRRISDSACAAAGRFRRAALLVKCLAQASRLRSLAVPFLEHSSRAD
jgi:hypothetical protein